MVCSELFGTMFFRFIRGVLRHCHISDLSPFVVSKLQKANPMHVQQWGSVAIEK